MRPISDKEHIIIACTKLLNLKLWEIDNISMNLIMAILTSIKGSKEIVFLHHLMVDRLVWDPIQKQEFFGVEGDITILDNDPLWRAIRLDDVKHRRRRL